MTIEQCALIAQLPRYKSEAKALGQTLGEYLSSTLSVTSSELLMALAEEFAYPYLTMSQLRELEPDFQAITWHEAGERGCLLLKDTTDKQYFVFSDPYDLDIQPWLNANVRNPVIKVLATNTDIAAYLKIHEESLRATDEVFAKHRVESQATSTLPVLSLQSINQDSSPVIKLVNSTLFDAIRGDVSDIHVEATPQGLAIKHRVDGVLNLVGEIPGIEFAEQVISRIKVISELDIAERRVPQDGRFKVAIQDREVDFRVSIMPSTHGEDAVLRILDRKSLSDDAETLSLFSLGFTGSLYSQIKRLISVPYGMFLVTGPTGSGKTTTLYAAISEIKHVQDKIVTIEDPVEYQLNGVLQIPVNEKKGLTFARGLRSILRHDPDKIMVGEIRDSETAQIAVQSALTGHLVFTTVHANNSFDVISRFIHMGVDPYSFVSALNGVLAQRLVRINCPHCALPYTPDADLLIESGISSQEAQSYHFLKGQGCSHCSGIGYKGRRVVAELLILDDSLRELIVTRKPVRLVKEKARQNGMRYIRETALDLVRNGQTTLEEINRVTFVV